MFLMTKHCLVTLMAVLILACIFVQTSVAAVVVGSCKTGVQFSTIQGAVNASPSGATIDICPGTYPEQVSITKNLTLTGVSSGTSDAAVVVPPSGGLVTNGNDIFGNPVAAQVFVQGATATISHLTVDGNGNGLSGCATDIMGIYFQNSPGKIIDNAVRNQILGSADLGCQVGLAINVESNSGTPAVTISSNSVRNYQKNGITASGPGTSGGPVVTITSNTVIGIGATTAIAQNGIQIGFGATGEANSNHVIDDIYINPPNCGSACYGSSGILIYASSGVIASSNTVESTQLGIVPATDPTYGPADGTTVNGNHIGGTQNFDAIDLCSDGNTAEMNVIYGSAQSGIHLDDSCAPSTGGGNTVTGNTINEACAGILLGSGTGNTTTPNTFMNVTNTKLSGDSCTPTDSVFSSKARTSEKRQSLRPSPYKKR
jgi:Right handed beta helix region